MPPPINSLAPSSTKTGVVQKRIQVTLRETLPAVESAFKSRERCRYDCTRRRIGCDRSYLTQYGQGAELTRRWGLPRDG